MQLFSQLITIIKISYSIAPDPNGSKSNAVLNKPVDKLS